MLLILCLLVFFVLLCIFVTYFICFEKRCDSKSVYNLSINSEIPSRFKALKKIIGLHLQDDILLIVLQDDITFLDTKYYWPDRTAYVHLSDVDEFLGKYSSRNDYPLEEINYFIKTKMKIY